MPFFVYILKNSSSKLYVGQTNNLENRIKQHLTKDWKSAKFTKDNDDFKLIYKEEYATRVEAMKREIQLKGWSRAKKEALIVGDFDKLKSLSKRKTE